MPQGRASAVPSLRRCTGSVNRSATGPLPSWSTVEVMSCWSLATRSAARALSRSPAPPPDRSVASSLWVRRQGSAAIHERVTRRSDSCAGRRRSGLGQVWAPLFGAQAEPEVVSTARKVALEQDVADLMTGVRAFYDRRDHAEFLGSWSGAGPAGVKPQNGRLLAAGAS
jgi:hypothetical protein